MCVRETLTLCVPARELQEQLQRFVHRCNAGCPARQFSSETHRRPRCGVKRIGDRMVEFATPPRRAGFGTEGILQQSDQQIAGIVALNPATEDTGLSVLWVRLRAGQESLSAAITGLEAKCLRRLQSWGC
jgi:hypothetical protein